MKTYCHPDDLERAIERFDAPDMETRDWLPRGYIYYANPAPIRGELHRTPRCGGSSELSRRTRKGGKTMIEYFIALLMMLFGWNGQCAVDKKASRHYPKPEPICRILNP